MRLASTKISFEELHRSLKLSEDIQIDDLFLNNDDRYMRTIHVVLSGDSPVIPEHQEGSQLATNPLYFFQNIQPLYTSPVISEGFYSGIKRYL